MAVEDFAKGANILQQVDVSQIFKSLAMGIAEAQQELDDNSISQLERLSETELAGKSLLELGFVPAFYSFTYADISASIHLRMAEKTELELGVKANFDYASSSAGESDFENLSKEYQFFSEKGEFKSNRKFSMKSSSTSRVKVNNQYYALEQNEGSVSMVEKMHDELIADSHIERVNIQKSSAYTTVYFAEQNFTSLAINQYSPSATATVGSLTVTIATDFAATFPSSPPTGMFGFSGSQVWGLGSGVQDLVFYFDFDKRVMDFAYDQTYSGFNKRAMFNALGAILRVNPNLKITIEGYTDGSGPDAYNDHLSLDRCNALLNWLLAKGADLTQLKTQGNGETGAVGESPAAQYRRVKVVLPPGFSYIYFPVYDVTPALSGGSTTNVYMLPPVDGFILTNEGASQFVAEGESSAFASLTDYEEANETHFYSETREDILHLLHKDTELTFMAYSEESENIEIAAEEGSESEVKVYNNENEQERFKSLATKNNSNKRFAAGASIDFRFARQFEMSVEGSASMSAHMVAVPPPEKVITHISTAFNLPAEEETE